MCLTQRERRCDYWKLNNKIKQDHADEQEKNLSTM